MYCAFSVMKDTKNKEMIDVMLKKYMLIMVLLFSVMLPINSFGAGTVKMAQVMTLYSDDNAESPGPLKQPMGVACSEDSFIVADSGNGRLLKYSFLDGEVKAEAEFKVPELLHPVTVGINSKGDIFALDGIKRRIVRLSPDGKFISFVEPAGMPSQSSYVPKSFYIDKSDNMYILDIFSERVIVLDPEGAYLKQIKFHEDTGFASDVSVDFKGNVLLVDSINARIFYAAKGSEVFSPLTESLRNHVRFPTNLTTDKRGRIHLVDRNGSLIISLGQDGSFLGQSSGFGWKDGLLNYPSQICMNSKGEVAIADTNNSRVQIFKLLR